MNPEEIKESIREFLYDLERAKTDDEIHDLIMHYAEEWPMAYERDWKKVAPQFKPAIRAKELLYQWANRA